MWNFLLLSTVCLMFSLIYQFYFGYPASIVENPKTEYDYVIVGAGTAGCVIASRLSETPEVSVLLVEAGGFFAWFSSIPLAAPLLQGTDADWAYVTEPQKFSSKGLRDQKQFWPRGKGLGGTGQINYLIHSFGVPEDYLNWPNGWNHADLLPYFERVKNKMDISVVPTGEKLAKAFYTSQTGIAGKNTTFTPTRNTVKKGARWSSYHAYLRQTLDRKNLHILMNTIVTRVHFEKLTAQAVEIRYPNGTTGLIKAKREIILCAGAINTPQLLLMSGVGPARELQMHNITVVRHLEQVGKNLFDHLNVPIFVYLNASVSVTLNKLKSVSEIFNYFVFGSGMLASNAIVGTGRSGHNGIILFGMGSADETLLKDIANFHTQCFNKITGTVIINPLWVNQTFRAMFPSYADPKQEGFIYLVNCLQPKSRGNVTLRSPHFSDQPIIDPGYLESNYDIACTHAAINLAIKTLDTKEFIELGATAHIPNLKECSRWQQDYANREYTECLTRTVGLASHHPGGTCKIGKKDDNDAVVDEYLKVIGVDKLRIVDASILPSPVSGMPNSVIIAVAEHAADIIMTHK